MLPDDFQQKLQQHYLSAFPGLIEELELKTLDLERGAHKDAYFSIYRQVHSLKGSGGTYGYPIVSSICHQFEDLLSEYDENTRFDKSTMDKVLFFIDLLKTTSDKMLRGDIEFNDIENQLQKNKTPDPQRQISALLVDGSKNSHLLIAEALADKNIVISHCNDGIEALQRLLHEKFDLLISSKELPELNGIALIAATRLSGKVNRSIKAALLTSDQKLNVPEYSDIDLIIKKDKDFISSLTEFVNTLRTK